MGMVRRLTRIPGALLSLLAQYEERELAQHRMQWWLQSGAMVLLVVCTLWVFTQDFWLTPYTGPISLTAFVSIFVAKLRAWRRVRRHRKGSDHPTTRNAQL